MNYSNKEQNDSQKVIAIIIPVFNGLNYTKGCLKSLSRMLSGISAPGIDFQIIVVDDASSDGTTSWINENYPSLHLLHGNGNLWWSGGVNKGMRYAIGNLNADYVLWWNNDIQPSENYFEELLKIIYSTGNNVVVGSKIFMLNQNLIWGMGGKFNPSNGLRYMYGEQEEDSEAYHKTFEVDWFPGMGTLIHHTVYDKIGLLDEKNFPQYHGDSDFTFRAKKAGFKLIAYPQLVIYNDNTNTGLKHNNKFFDFYKTLTSIKSNYNLKKDIVFYQKHNNSLRAYLPLIIKYGKYVGGFYKWKILNYLGIQRS